jgi:predicted metal-dependent peptidase
MLLVEAGLKPPMDAYTSYKYIGMSMEEIYELLDAFSNHKFDDEQFGKVEDSPELGEKEKDSEPDKPGDTRKDQLHGSQKEQKRQEAIEKNKSDMREALQAAKIMGYLSPDLERYLEKITKSDTNWKDIVSEYVVKSTDREDYTFSRPNRRYEGDFIMPGLFSERAPEMKFAGDTSGSVSKQELKEMARDVVSIMEDVQPEKLTVMWFDRRIQGVQIFEEGDVVNLKPKGGGGTDYIPVFKEIEKMGDETDLLVVLTDGYCNSFPSSEPDYPVLWVVWQDRHEFKPPFGEVVVMLRKKK